MNYLIYPCGCKFEIVDPTIVEDIYVKNILDPIPKIKLDLDNINKNCKTTWNLICEGKTLGCFQIESHLGKSWCKKIQPHNINELSDIISGIRPGCLESFIDGKHLTQHYCDRKHGREEVIYENDIIKSILQSTQNLILYQEQSILLASKVAGFSLQDADLLRKAVGKRDPALMSSLASKFIDGCEKTGVVTKERGKELFEMIRASQRYSFNKSHSTAYAIIGYQTAFCKTHFPLQFFCKYLTGAIFKEKPLEEIRDLVKDARQFNIDILPPDIRNPQIDFYLNNKTIKFGLGQVRNIGSVAVNNTIDNLHNIEKEIGLPVSQWKWLDYLIYTHNHISSSIQEALINCGACDFLDNSRRRMLFEFNLFNKLSPGEINWVINNYKIYKWQSLTNLLIDCGQSKKEGGGCHSTKRAELVTKLALSLQQPPHTLEDNILEIAQQEEKYLGIALTISKIDGKLDASKATHIIKNFINSIETTGIIAVEIDEIKPVKTKKGKNPGQDMCFFSVNDSSGSISGIVCFPKNFLDYEDLLYTGNTVLLQLSRNTNQEGFIADKLWQI